MTRYELLVGDEPLWSSESLVELARKAERIRSRFGDESIRIERVEVVELRSTVELAEMAELVSLHG